jgi:AI-2 transport protein TqsA
MSAESERASRLQLISTCAVILAVTSVGFILYVMKPVMVPLVLAILLSFVVLPIVDHIQVRFKLPRSASVTIALILCGLVIGAVVLLATHSVVSMQPKVPEYQAKLTEIGESALNTLQGWGIPVKTQMSDLPVSTFLVSTLESLAASFTNLLLILIFVVYLVADRKPHIQQTGFYGEVEAQIRKYLLMKVSVSCFTGFCVWAILALVGLDLAAVFGLMAFALNFIPSLGSVIATLLPIPLALVQFDSTLPVVLVIVFPGGLQFFIGNIFEPRFMGSKLKIHPVTLMLSLVFWGVLWGFPGMILATPITVVIKIVLERREGTMAIARLMEGDFPGVNYSDSREDAESEV